MVLFGDVTIHCENAIKYNNYFRRLVFKALCCNKLPGLYRVKSLPQSL